RVIPYTRHRSVMVHSPDWYSARNCFRFSTTPLTFQGMKPSTRLRGRTKLVKHVPGLICKLCARFVPCCSPGRQAWENGKANAAPAGAAQVLNHPLFRQSSRFQPWLDTGALLESQCSANDWRI